MFAFELFLLELIDSSPNKVNPGCYQSSVIEKKTEKTVNLHLG